MEAKILDYPTLTEEEIKVAKKKLEETIAEAMLYAELEKDVWTGYFVEKNEFKNPLVHIPVYEEFESKAPMTIKAEKVTPGGKVMIVRWKK